MRAVPLPLVVLVAAAFGYAGWRWGRASVEQVVHVVEASLRAEPAPIPRPLLEGGRGSGGGSGESRKTLPAQTASGPGQPTGDLPAQGALLPAHRLEDGVEFRRLQVGSLPDDQLLGDLPTEPAAATEAARLMLSSPEEAASKIESLLESRDAKERAAAYRLLAEARHPSHQALVQRAQREAKTDDEIRTLLAALARFKGPNWNAVQITGAPDTPLAGDLATAWASKQPDMGEVWIELEYAQAVTPDAVRVHETFNPGAITRVLAQRPDGSWALLWEGTATANPAPTWFEPRLETVRFSTTRIRLIVDTGRVEGWNEIDAVEVIGDGRRQWAIAAQAASNYSD
jgi:hypothetical protein